jgi:sugar O-acyltransferase (sialic acid O-acetyltransferase NeuD family)
MSAGKRNIVVIGASGHAKVVVDIIEKEGRYTIAGLLDSGKESGTTFAGYSVLGNEDYLREVRRLGRAEAGIIAIGDNWVRHQVAQRFARLEPDFPFVSAIHPSAQIGSNVSVGAGSVVMPGAVINSDTQVGRFCIVNTNASVDHDCVIGDYACILPGAVLGGNVRIGAFSVVALGAHIVHGITVGEHTVIGAGATVLSDIGDGAVAWGTPAQVMRARSPGERYL